MRRLSRSSECKHTANIMREIKGIWIRRVMRSAEMKREQESRWEGRRGVQLKSDLLGCHLSRSRSMNSSIRSGCLRDSRWPSVVLVWPADCSDLRHAAADYIAPSDAECSAFTVDHRMSGGAQRTQRTSAPVYSARAARASWRVINVPRGYCIEPWSGVDLCHWAASRSQQDSLHYARVCQFMDPATSRNVTLWPPAHVRQCLLYARNSTSWRIVRAGRRRLQHCYLVTPALTTASLFAGRFCTRCSTVFVADLARLVDCSFHVTRWRYVQRCSTCAVSYLISFAVDDKLACSRCLLLQQCACS